MTLIKLLLTGGNADFLFDAIISAAKCNVIILSVTFIPFLYCICLEQFTPSVVRTFSVMNNQVKRFHLI